MIGILCLAGVPYEIANELYGVSRPYYYSLRVSAAKVLEVLFSTGELAEGMILITRNFIERCVMALSFYCRAPIEGIVAFCDLVLGYHVSKGKIHEIRELARQKAKEYDESVSLANIEAVAIDEIFQQSEPILTGVDLATRYIFIMEPAENRRGETWRSVIEEKKQQGFSPYLNASDGGSGLLKGISDAFPGIDTQLDVFHAIRALGIEVHKQDRRALAQLSELYSLETRLKGQRVHKRTVEKYNEINDGIDLCLKKVDTLNILLSWLKEYVSFSGYGYAKSMKVCNWILDEMSLLYPEHKKLLGEINSFRKRLPDLLQFLRRLTAAMDNVAPSFHTNGHAFMLMYNQRAYPPQSNEHEFIEKKLYHIFRHRLPEARAVLSQLIGSTYRASSMIENVNGCLRDFIDLKREIPETCFPLIKVFFNTKKAIRSRKKGWKGTSALDRLTGKDTPDFLDIVVGPRQSIA